MNLIEYIIIELLCLDINHPELDSDHSVLALKLSVFNSGTPRSLAFSTKTEYFRFERASLEITRLSIFDSNARNSQFSLRLAGLAGDFVVLKAVTSCQSGCIRLK